MENTLLIAMSVGTGSLIAGLASVTTTWVTQHSHNRRELARDEIRKREALYGEFIGECAKLLMDALDHTLEKPEVLRPAYALANRIRLAASPSVLQEAEELLRRITGQYFASNLTVEELRRIAHSGDPDPMKPFAEACRAELQALRARL